MKEDVAPKVPPDGDTGEGVSRLGQKIGPAKKLDRPKKSRGKFEFTIGPWVPVEWLEGNEVHAARVYEARRRTQEGLTKGHAARREEERERKRRAFDARPRAFKRWKPDSDLARRVEVAVDLLGWCTAYQVRLFTLLPRDSISATLIKLWRRRRIVKKKNPSFVCLGLGGDAGCAFIWAVKGAG